MQNSFPNYATWHREISPSISSRPWFHLLDLPRSTIVNFSRLCLSHNLFPFHESCFPLTHRHLILYTRLKLIVTFFTSSLTVRFSHMNVVSFFSNSPFKATSLTKLYFSLNLFFPSLFFNS